MQQRVYSKAREWIRYFFAEKQYCVSFECYFCSLKSVNPKHISLPMILFLFRPSASSFLDNYSIWLQLFSSKTWLSKSYLPCSRIWLLFGVYYQVKIWCDLRPNQKNTHGPTSSSLLCRLSIIKLLASLGHSSSISKWYMVLFFSV